MHPVFDHIQARRNLPPPFNDGRKIALVLYGGIMLGVRGAGSLRALEEAGLGLAFDEIYTMSSGFLNASYFLSGQIEEALEIYPGAAAGKKFLNRWRLWKVADIDYLQTLVSQEHPLNIAAVHQNPTRLYAMFINANQGTQEYLEVHRYPPEEYLNMIRASASLPFVGRGTTTIGGIRYRDIFRDHNLADLMRHVLDTDATDILALYNYPWQKEYVDQKIGLTPKNKRVFAFCPCPEPMSRFETRPNLLRQSGELARNRTATLLRPPVV